MSESILWLSEDLQPCAPAEASLKLTFASGVLRLDHRRSGYPDFIPANPYSLGAAIFPRTVAQADPTALQSFLTALPDDSPPTQAIAAFKDYSAHTARHRAYAADEFNVVMSQEMALTLAKLYVGLYPLFHHHSLPSQSNMIYDGFYGLGAPHETPLPYQALGDYRAFTAEVWGEARKDTLRITRRLSDKHLALLYCFKRVLPPAVLAPLVQEYLSDALQLQDFPVTPEAYSVLTGLSMHQRKSLLVALLQEKQGLPYEGVLPGDFIADTLAMLSSVPEERRRKLRGATTWEELHRRTMIHATAHEKLGELKVPGAVQRLSEVPLLDYRVKPLTQSRDFLAGGDALSICLGQAGYYQKALNGESYCLLGSTQTGELAWALEVEFHHPSWRVRQLRGRDNTRPPDEEALVALINTIMNGGSAHADYSL